MPENHFLDARDMGFIIRFQGPGAMVKKYCGVVRETLV
jgi:hypothetical protein